MGMQLISNIPGQVSFWMQPWQSPWEVKYTFNLLFHAAGIWESLSWRWAEVLSACCPTNNGSQKQQDQKVQLSLVMICKRNLSPEGTPSLSPLRGEQLTYRGKQTNKQKHPCRTGQYGDTGDGHSDFSVAILNIHSWKSTCCLKPCFQLQTLTRGFRSAV